MFAVCLGQCSVRNIAGNYKTISCRNDDDDTFNNDKILLLGFGKTGEANQLVLESFKAQ
jgi:hypothetical protein